MTPAELGAALHEKITEAEVQLHAIEAGAVSKVEAFAPLLRTLIEAFRVMVPVSAPSTSTSEDPPTPTGPNGAAPAT